MGIECDGATHAPSAGSRQPVIRPLTAIGFHFFRHRCCRTPPIPLRALRMKLQRSTSTWIAPKLCCVAQLPRTWPFLQFLLSPLLQVGKQLEGPLAHFQPPPCTAPPPTMLDGVDSRAMEHNVTQRALYRMNMERRALIRATTTPHPSSGLSPLCFSSMSLGWKLFPNRKSGGALALSVAWLA